MTTIDLIRAFLALCEHQERKGKDGEFWRRLAGSVRKAATKI